MRRGPASGPPRAVAPSRVSAPSTIELGLDRAPPPGMPPWSRHRRRRWWARRRQATIAVLTVGAVLAAFAPDPGPPVSPLVQIAEREHLREDFQVLGDLLFVQEPTPADGSQPVWSAHQLPTGSYLWSTPGWPQQVTDGVVLTSRADPFPRTTGRDAASGSAVWRAGERVMPIPGTRLGVRLGGLDPTPPEVELPLPAWYRQVAVVDLTTGARHWSLRTGQRWRVVTGAAAVVTVDAGGAAEVRDPVTGEIRASGHLPELAGTGFGHIHDDTLVVFGDDTGDAQPVRGYRLPGLDLRWQLHPPPSGGGEYGRLASPGRTHWHTTDEFHLLDERSGELLTLPRPRAGELRVWDDLVVITEGFGQVMEVVDPGSGRRRAVPSGWSLVEPQAGPLAELLLTRPAGDGTALGRLDLGTGEISRLGRHPERLSGCHAFDGGLVCRVAARLGLWRWR